MLKHIHTHTFNGKGKRMSQENKQLLQKKKENEGQDFYLVVVAILYKLDKCCLLLLFLVNVGPCLPVEKELISFFNYVIK